MNAPQIGTGILTSNGMGLLFSLEDKTKNKKTSAPLIVQADYLICTISSDILEPQSTFIGNKNTAPKVKKTIKTR